MSPPAAWPGLAEYNAALLSPRQAFADPELAAGRVETGGMGMPLARSGGFAYIWRVELPGGGRLAVRCFKEGRDDRAERYRRILPALRSASGAGPGGPWVHTEYQEEGLRVGGRAWPLVKMDWAEGKTLGGYLEEHHRDPVRLSALRAAFRELAAGLEVQGIAHGDIQVGNVICGEGALKLIDYDGLFVPGLEGWTGLDSGHRNFQHPGRSGADFHAGVDRFAFILLELSLAALERSPDLYARFSTGENVLFSRADFADPDASAVFRALSGLTGLQGHAACFAQVCRGSFAAVPGLEDFIGLSGLEAASRPGAAGAGAAAAGAAAAPGAARARPAYQGPYPVFSAMDYDDLLQESGSKVEVIGRVAGVRESTTQYGKPYVFINFGPWRQDGFKINVWSEGLDSFRRRPDDSLAGAWVSVIGLVDEPYESEKFGYTHVSVTVHDSSQLHRLTAEEAAWRLGRIPEAGAGGRSAAQAGAGDGPGGAGAGGPVEAGPGRRRNRVGAHLSGVSPVRRTPPAPRRPRVPRTPAAGPVPPAARGKPSNRDLIRMMEQGKTPAGGGPAPGNPPRSAPSSIAPLKLRVKKRSPRRSFKWIFRLLLIAGILYALYRIFD